MKLFSDRKARKELYRVGFYDEVDLQRERDIRAARCRLAVRGLVWVLGSCWWFILFTRFAK
jgi:hypothetical protein